MKHLNQYQLLEWIESGRADTAWREHVKDCLDCAHELDSLREVYHMVTSRDSATELDETRAEQFRVDLRRKIQQLPEPGSLHTFWNWVQETVWVHPALVSAAATAVLVFSIVAFFEYGKMQTPVGPPTATSAEAMAASVAVADAVVANDTLKPSDFIEASIKASSRDELESGDLGGISQDPFHALSDLKPEEVSQLKTLLKEKLKS